MLDPVNQHLHEVLVLRKLALESVDVVGQEPDLLLVALRLGDRVEVLLVFWPLVVVALVAVALREEAVPRGSREQRLSERVLLPLGCLRRSCLSACLGQAEVASHL